MWVSPVLSPVSVGTHDEVSSTLDLILTISYNSLFMCFLLKMTLFLLSRLGNSGLLHLLSKSLCWERALVVRLCLELVCLRMPGGALRPALPLLPSGAQGGERQLVWSWQEFVQADPWSGYVCLPPSQAASQMCGLRISIYKLSPISSFVIIIPNSEDCCGDDGWIHEGT